MRKIYLAAFLLLAIGAMAETTPTKVPVPFKSGSDLQLYSAYQSYVILQQREQIQEAKLHDEYAKQAQLLTEQIRKDFDEFKAVNHLGPETMYDPENRKAYRVEKTK